MWTRDRMAKGKCLVVGDSGVGKSCLLIGYGEEFFPTYSNIFFNNSIAHIKVDGVDLALNLWDTDAKEQYEGLNIPTYPNPSVLIMCFSIDSPTSFDNVKEKWYPEAHQRFPGIPILLVGTKTDLRKNPETIKRLKEQKQVPIATRRGIKLSEQIQAVGYMECSALNQEGIKEIIIEAGRAVLNPTPAKPKKDCRLL